LHAVGQPRNTFNLYQQIYDGSGKPIEGLFEDRNRDGIINDNDRYLNHSAVGDYMFGFSSNVTVKKFSAGFVMRATLNNYVYNNVNSNRGRLNQVLGATTIGNAVTNYLDTRFRGSVDVQPLSDYYVENASFLRMDNLYAAYNFGKVFKGEANLRATGSVQNVFVLTNYSGIDPEHANGIDRNLYPRPRIFSLGLNLDF
jgi:hypothetical protein